MWLAVLSATKSIVPFEKVCVPPKSMVSLDWMDRVPFSVRPPVMERKPLEPDLARSPVTVMGPTRALLPLLVKRSCAPPVIVSVPPEIVPPLSVKVPVCAFRVIVAAALLTAPVMFTAPALRKKLGRPRPAVVTAPPMLSVPLSAPRLPAELFHEVAAMVRVPELEARTVPWFVKLSAVIWRPALGLSALMVPRFRMAWVPVPVEVTKEVLLPVPPVIWAFAAIVSVEPSAPETRRVWLAVLSATKSIVPFEKVCVPPKSIVSLDWMKRVPLSVRPPVTERKPLEPDLARSPVMVMGPTRALLPLLVKSSCAPTMVQAPPESEPPLRVVAPSMLAVVRSESLPPVKLIVSRQTRLLTERLPVVVV